MITLTPALITILLMISVSWTLYVGYTIYYRNRDEKKFKRPYFFEFLITNITLWWIAIPISALNGIIRDDYMRWKNKLKK